MIKAERLLFMIERSFEGVSQSLVIPLYGALVQLHLEYDMETNPHGQYQPFESTITAGNLPSSSSLERNAAANLGGPILDSINKHDKDTHTHTQLLVPPLCKGRRNMFAKHVLRCDRWSLLICINHCFPSKNKASPTKRAS